MVAATIGATVVGSMIQADMAGDAASQAAQVQGESSAAATAERRRQFDVAQGLLQPWVTAGGDALSGQRNLIGLNGAAPQQSAIDAIKGGPAFTSMQKTGQNAILSAASATGGLRGGNVNAALAQYDDTLLSGLIDQQYSRLTGLSTQGQNAANGVASNAINLGNNVAADTIDAGAATAGGILGNARASSSFINSAVNAAGMLTGARASTPNTLPTAVTPSGTPYMGGFGGGPVFS